MVTFNGFYCVVSMNCNKCVWKKTTPRLYQSVVYAASNVFFDQTFSIPKICFTLPVTWLDCFVDFPLVMLKQEQLFVNI